MKKRELPEELLNSDGKLVPVARIRKDHLDKHLLVEELFDQLMEHEQRIEKLKAKVMRRIARYNRAVAKRAGIQEVALKNLTLSNYSNTKKIRIQQNTVISFDDNIVLAKEYIDKCLKKWAKGANANLCVIIEGYFRVDKKGLLDKASILKLFQLEIKDADWQTAMEYIRKSIWAESYKQSTTLHHRPDKDAAWKTVNLNFSTVEVK